ncbi:hypothetical protein Pan44_22670 [Caulifigura coniformis]|uniref:DUF1579 domain-containing protein n=1 Tax=Caulifigura coniformis TaxID=2527983 RepID=A0A517SDN7_9PLAN|nr:DUF1579 domain-containing protein [Caulifigura coniformis]QDT54239.1 hypothetical protein Pan44_22670 [Caulifigura coniformis]
MRSLVAAALVLVVAPGLARAQDPSPFPTPQKEHEWLNQFVGEWSAESECTPVPGQPPVKGKMEEKVRPLGGFWVISEGDAEMAGVKMQVVMTIGYSPEKKKYIGTWTDSMMPHMWHYEGTLDPSGKILTLEADGPSMLNPGKTAKYRDITEFKSRDERHFTSYIQDDKGEWVKIVSSVSRRKK